MWVLCLITVVFNNNGKYETKEERISGVVIQQMKESLRVDFSEETTKNKYIGDYSHVVISKDLCYDIVKGIRK